MPTATLKIFLAFGDPKRLRTAELSNWTGKAVAGPRSEFEKVLEREESQNSGVYFLSGIDPDTNKSAIYIGEAECIRDRKQFSKREAQHRNGQVLWFKGKNS